MKYTFKGKNVTIPDSELMRSMKSLKISQEEAIQMWLEDNDFCINEEQHALIEKTKGQKLHLDAKSDKPKEKRKRTVKIDNDKIKVINLIESILIENGYENVTIENSQKLIGFEINGEHFTINLTKQRKKKD